jgi:outer membrane protein OmpA-like peptidoglycan-associated protein
LVVDGTTYDCATTACSIFVMRDRRNGGTADTTLDSITPISFFATATSQRIGFRSGAKSLSKANKKKIKSDLASYQAASQIVITATAGMTPGASNKVVRSLAKKRANAIKKYLVAQGVPAEKIVIKTKITKSGKKPSTRVVATP